MKSRWKEINASAHAAVISCLIFHMLTATDDQMLE